MRPLPMPQPTLTAQRVRLRPFTLADASELQRLAGDRRVAEMTLNIPCPYPDGAAVAFIASHPEQYASKHGVAYAIVNTADALIGGMGFVALDGATNEAEMGYWVAYEHWSKGYASEAAGALLEFGFDTLVLNRVTARHIVRNPASGRVMEKLGMAILRTEHGLPWRDGAREDHVFRAITRAQWNGR